MERTSSSGEEKLHCHKFDLWVATPDAACTQPEEYCELRERCGIFFMMTERDRSKKQRKKEDNDAPV